MGKTIDKLTPEQEARIPEHLKEYMEIGWCSEPSDRHKAEEAMAALYKRTGKKVPEFVWFDSPLGAVKCIFESTGERVTLFGEDGNLDAPWLCHRTFCASLIPDLDEDLKKHLSEWDQLCRSTGPCYPYTNYCLMTERPVRALRDEQDLLHSEDGPALQYKDGFAVYAIHGVRLPKVIAQKAVETPWLMTIEDIDGHDFDEDIRTLLLNRWCWEEKYSDGNRKGINGHRYLIETGANPIHADKYEVVPGVFARRVLMEDRDGRKFMICPDGSTDRVYCIQVGREATTCAEAHESINGGIPDSEIGLSS